MTLGQKIVVFNGGRIEQVGTPLDLYERPANLFVAGFLGSPRMNFIPATLAGEEGATAAVRLPDGSVAEVAADVGHARVGAALTLGVRPEHLRLLGDAAPGSSSSGSSIAATVVLVEYLGDVTLVHAKVEGVEGILAAKCNAGGTAPAVGSRVRLGVEPGKAYLFDDAGKAFAPSRAGVGAAVQ
jgi:multiple sugar transport system ATP-binding protein